MVHQVSRCNALIHLRKGGEGFVSLIFTRIPDWRMMKILAFQQAFPQRPHVIDATTDPSTIVGRTSHAGPYVRLRFTRAREQASQRSSSQTLAPKARGLFPRRGRDESPGRHACRSKDRARPPARDPPRRQLEKTAKSLPRAPRARRDRQPQCLPCSLFPPSRSQNLPVGPHPLRPSDQSTTRNPLAGVANRSTTRPTSHQKPTEYFRTREIRERVERGILDRRVQSQVMAA